MENLCITCLCERRNLIYIGDTELQEIYLQLLNKPVTKMLESYLQICWECEAILNRFKQFKIQTLNCYGELWNYVQQGKRHSIPKLPRLTVCSVVNINITDKDEQKDTNYKLETFADELKLEYKNENNNQEIKEEQVKEEQITSTSDISDIEDVNNDPIADDKEPLSTYVFEVKIEAREAEQTLETKKQNVQETIITIEGTKGSKSKQIKYVKKEIAQKRSKKEAVPKKVNKNAAPKRNREVVPDNLQCLECDKLFASRKTYRAHMRNIHTTRSQEKWPCPRCERTFRWKCNLDRHITNHKAADSGQLYCSMCDMKFSSVATYKQHMSYSRRHNPDRARRSEGSFTCDECGKTFRNKLTLRDHIDWEHLNNIKNKCHYCDKAFRSSASLAAHVQNIHSTEEEHNLCHVCGKSFKSKKYLSTHMWSHAGRQYRCGECGLSFPRYPALAHHRKKHAPAVPYECAVCGKRYSNYGNRQRHILMAHGGGEKRFKCEECGKRFAMRSGLRSHVDHVHRNVPWPTRAPRTAPPDDALTAKQQPKKYKKAKKLDEII